MDGSSAIEVAIYVASALVAIMLLPEIMLRVLGSKGRPPLFEGIPFIGGCFKFAKVHTPPALSPVASMRLCCNVTGHIK